MASGGSPTLVAAARMGSHEGSYVCPAGKCMLSFTFNNTFSWMNKKTLSFKIEMLRGDGSPSPRHLRKMIARRGSIDPSVTMIGGGIGGGGGEGGDGGGE